MKTKACIVFAFVTLGAVALGAPQTFDFKDPKGINNVGFKLDAPLEAINGNATGISGKVTFDPENPAATKGKLVVATSSMHLGNPMQQQHMQGEKWLDAARYPEISFEAKEIKNAKCSGEVTTADVVGTFKLKNVTKDITVPVTFTYLKDKLGQRVPSMHGDLLVLRSNFSIKRSEFALNSGQFEDKVSDTIDLTLSVAGAAPK